MNWYGLNWTNILLGTAILAIIPFAFALYGGYLATESMASPKRQRNIKLQFWGLFLVGVALAFWQQFRSAEDDLDRNTKDVWAETIAMSKFPPPPPPAYIEHGKSPVKPRSYLAFNGEFRIPETRDRNGQLLPDQHFKVGGRILL